MIRSKTVPSALCALSLLLLTACAAAPAGMLTPLDLDLELARQRLPAVTYTVRGEVHELDLQQMGITVRSEPIEEVFRRAFTAAREIEASAPAPIDPDAVHLDLYLRRSARHVPISVCTAALSLGSAGLLPAYAYEEIYLDVRVLRAGQPWRQYLYEDGVETWFHLFLLPWSFRDDPGDVAAATTANALLHFLADLRRDLAGQP